MDEPPAVSVIIPTYGRPELVAQLVRTLAKQTKPPAEVLVVDDTPGDEVRARVEALDGLPFPVRYHRKPGRPSLTRARNLGMDRARGDVLLFLDSDVRLLDEHIENCLEVLHGPDAPAAVQGYVPHTWPHRRLSRRIPLALFLQGINAGTRMRFSPPMRNTFPDRAADAPVHSDWLSGSNMMLDRRRVGDLRFDPLLERYCLGEDLEFSLQLAAVGLPMMLVPDAVVEERNDDEGRLESRDLALMRIINNRYILRKHFPGRRSEPALTWSDIGWILQKNPPRAWPRLLREYVEDRRAVRRVVRASGGFHMHALNRLYSFWEEP